MIAVVVVEFHAVDFVGAEHIRKINARMVLGSKHCDRMLKLRGRSGTQDRRNYLTDSICSGSKVCKAVRSGFVDTRSVIKILGRHCLQISRVQSAVTVQIQIHCDPGQTMFARIPDTILVSVSEDTSTDCGILRLRIAIIDSCHMLTILQHK